MSPTESIDAFRRAAEDPASINPSDGGVVAAAAAPDQDALAVESVVKYYGDVLAVDGVDLVVRRGELVTVLGPSGCGKSTLLRLIAGIEELADGTIWLSGREVAGPNRKVPVAPEDRELGMVFQSYALWPHMTVARNVGFPLKYANLTKSSRAARVQESLELVGLADLAERYPGELSGGQQQRVALARAVAARPKLLLLDEPLSNLDATLREDLREQIRFVQQKLQLSAIYVTHDQQEALAISDRIVVMREGTVLQDDTPEALYDHPADEFVARFLGYKNALQCEVDANGEILVCGMPSGLQVLTNGGGDKPMSLVAYAKPNAIRRYDGASSLDGAFVVEGRLEHETFRGDRYEQTVALDRDQVRIRTSSSFGVAAGEKVLIQIKRSGLRLYVDGVADRSASEAKHV